MRFIPFIIGLACFADCTQPSNSDLPRLAINVDKIQKSVPLSIFCDSLKYIPLETNENSIFKTIDRLEIDREGNIYILDREGTNAIYQFNSSGKFRRKIGEQGRAPGEYLEATDFTVYQDTIVEIYDCEQCKRILYSTKGTFLREYTRLYDYGSAEFLHVGDTLAYYTSAGGYSPNLTVLVDTLRYEFFKQNYPEMYHSSDHFTVTEGRIYCTDNFNDTIYRWETDRMRPWLYIDFMGNRLPEKIRDHGALVRNNDYCFDVGSLRFTDRFLYFTFCYGQNIQMAFCYRLEKNLQLVSSLKNDIDGMSVLFRWGMPTRPDYLVTYVSALHIVQQYEYNREHDLPVSPVLALLNRTVNESSNPVIVFAYTKK